MGQAPLFSSPPTGGESTVKKASHATTWVVLGILGGCGCFGLIVMAAILLPVFSQARKAAVKTQSLSNLKKIGTGLWIYAADHNDRFPKADTWQDSVQLYLGSMSMDGVKVEKPENVFRPPYKKNPGSYAFNRVLSGAMTAEISDPAQTVMVFEAAPEDRNVNGGIDIARREENYLLVGMADSSVRSRPIATIDKLVWDPKVKPQPK